MSDELIERLVAAPNGMFQLEIGVQSTDSETLSRISRHESVERLCEVTKRLSKNRGLHLHLDLIAGLPGEDLQTFIKSFNDVYALAPQALQLGFLKKLHGVKICTSGSCFCSFPPYEVICTDAMTYSDIVHLKRIAAAVERLYNSGVFTHTLRILCEKFKTPFEMFEALTGFYDFSSAVSQKRIYEILYAFVSEKFSDKRICEAIVYDFCLHNTDKLSFMENSGDIKSAAFEFLKNDEAVSAFVPQLVNIKPTERYKRLRFQRIGDSVFMFDIRQKLAFDVTKYFQNKKAAEE